MLRRASVLLGLAVLLSLLFPVKALLKESGVDPLAIALPAVDLAAACVLVALLPAWLLFHDGRLAQRIPRWSAWVGLLALCSLLFVLLHVDWSLQLAISWAGDALVAGSLPAGISPFLIVDGLELAARLGVLVCLLGVLTRLESVPDDTPVPAPVQRRKK